MRTTRLQRRDLNRLLVSSRGRCEPKRLPAQQSPREEKKRPSCWFGYVASRGSRPKPAWKDDNQFPPPGARRRHRNITHISQYKNIFKATPKTPTLLSPASNGQSARLSLQGLNLKDHVSLADPRPRPQHHLHQHCAATIQTRHTTREAPSKQAS